MTRFRYQVTETAGIYNTAGFNDDTRAFPSIPARHDLSRRVDANFLADLVARHIVSEGDARHMMRSLTYELVKSTYREYQGEGAEGAQRAQGKGAATARKEPHG